MAEGRIESLLVGKNPAGLLDLEASLPGRARALAQIAWILAVMLAPSLLGALAEGAAGWAIAGVLAALGVVLVWRGRGPGAAARVGISGGVIALVLLGFSSRPRALLDQGPRIGIQMENAGAGARVTKVVPDTPAAGHLREGDRIVAIDGKPLDAEDPSGDVTRRARDPHQLAGPHTSFRILRGGKAQTLELALPPPPPKTSGRTFFFELSVRDLCLLGLALLLVLSDGQRLRQIGLRRERLGRELGFGVLVLMGTYAVHLASSLPLAVIASALGAGKTEVAQRTGFLGELVGWAEQVRPWEIPIYMGLAGAFEEVVFRGFFITRMRRLIGSWAPALLLAAALFGLGHLEEGHLAAVQTAILGLWFGAVFIRRKRLESVIVAHAAFNTIMFAVMIFVLRSGLLDKAQQLLGH